MTPYYEDEWSTIWHGDRSSVDGCIDFRPARDAPLGLHFQSHRCNESLTGFGFQSMEVSRFRDSPIDCCLDPFLGTVRVYPGAYPRAREQRLSWATMTPANGGRRRLGSGIWWRARRVGMSVVARCNPVERLPVPNVTISKVAV